jgi:hypothetical protein
MLEADVTQVIGLQRQFRYLHGREPIGVRHLIPALRIEKTARLLPDTGQSSGRIKQPS